MAGVDLGVPAAPSASVHDKLDWPISDEGAPYALDLSRVVAIIPAFNEERNVGSVVLRLRHVLDSVIVVNDGSQDATEEVARLAGAQVISHVGNRGYGAAIRTGLAAAQKLDPRAVVLTDAQSGMRAFGPRALEALLLSSTSMAAASEMQFLASEARLRVCEVPIEIRYFGEVKRNPIGHGLDVLNGILRLVSLRRPLLFFGLPGLLLVMLGVFLALDVVLTFDRVHVLLVGQLIFAVAFMIIGVLSLFTSVVLNALQGLRNELRSHR